MRLERGRGGGRGPRLPHALMRELLNDGDQPARGDHGRGRSPRASSRGERGRPQRGRGPTRSGPGSVSGRAGHSSKRPFERDDGRKGAIKRHHGPETKFDELLKEGPVARVSSEPVVFQSDVDAEAKLQARLVKQLGMKGKNKKIKVGDAELDTLLGEMDMDRKKPAVGDRRGDEAVHSASRPLPSDSDALADSGRDASSSGHDTMRESGDSDYSTEDDELNGLLQDSEEEEGQGKGWASDSSCETDEEDGLDQSDEDSDDGSSLNEPLRHGTSDSEEVALEHRKGAEMARRKTGAAASVGAAQPTGDRPGGTDASGPAASRYIPPALRRGLAAAGDIDDHVQRAIRGLVNRLAESNIQGILKEIVQLYEVAGRRQVTDALVSEVVGAAAEGPRATDTFAAVGSAAVCALAASTGNANVLATFLDRVVARLELAVGAGDDGLAADNLVLTLGHLFLLKALRADVVYSLLEHWRRRFHERDVVALARLLRVCGLALRAADPPAMKDFVLAVVSSVRENGAALSQRAQALLDVVMDTKNNRVGGKGAGSARYATLSKTTTKWIQGLGLDAVAIGGIPWSAVLAEPKVGRWWLPTAATSRATTSTKATAAAGGVRGAGAGGEAATAEDAAADERLRALAAKLRMNTDLRRAVFFAVMGSEDEDDAFEKLAHVDARGSQEAEIVRVVVLCAVHEATYNPYYTALLTKLALTSRNHAKTLQFCVWEHLRTTVGEEGEGAVPGAARRLAVLAGLTADCAASGALRPSFLKVVLWSEPLSARETVFWRLFFETLLAKARDPAEPFRPLLVNPAAAPLRRDLAHYLRHQFGPWVAQQAPGQRGRSAEDLATLLQKVRRLERLLKA